jgi:hypothetical protein
VCLSCLINEPVDDFMTVLLSTQSSVEATLIDTKIEVLSISNQ